MAQPIEEILNHFFGEHQASKVVLAGDAGAGKTWVARKVCDAALKKELSYGSIWIVPAENPEKKPLLDTIASQLSLLSCDEEWVDDEDSEEVKEKKDKEQEDLKTRILDKLEKMRTGKPKNQALNIDRGIQGETELGHEAAAGKLRYLVVVLDNITEEEEESIVTELKNILHSSFLKMLIIRKESTDGNAGAARESKGDAIQPDDTKAIRLEPLSSRDALILLRGRVKTEVSENQMLAIAEKALGLPAGMILVAEALNHICLEDGVQAFEFAMDDVAKMKGDDITAVLQFAYDMLPEGVTRCCYWLSRQLFLSRAAVHFNELIAYWILEGCFDHHNLLEKAYEEGHCILMDLKDRGMLKGHGNYVYMERAMLKLPDKRRNGLSGAAKLGLADVLCNGLGRITLADGMIRTVCRDKENKEMSTLIIEGGRLCKEVSKEFFKSMKGLKVLAILNPMFEYLPTGLTELEDLQVLVLRGCQHLKEVGEICNLTKLSVLEISGASLLLHIDKDFFKGMANLKTINLSGLNTKSVPDSLFDRDEVRFLILRECLAFHELPSLRNMKKLEMVDLCGSASFERLSDGNINNLTDLKTLNVSGTKVRNLPILGKLAGLTRILLSNCPLLTMIRSLGGMTNLEVLDISGSMSIKDLNSAQLLNKPRFRILDLSRTGINSLPSSISNLSHFHLSGCSELEKFPSTKAFHNLVSLDLSGAVKLVEIGDKSFAHLKVLRHLNLSETEIAQLPSLSDLVELRELLLKGCKKLTQLRGLSPLEKLEVLDLSGCCDLIIGPEESFSRMSRLKKLDLSGTKIESLPLDCFPSNLRHLSLRDCNILKQLPSLESLSKLERLNLCGAESLPKFKADFLHHMVKLQILNLSKTHLDELPSLSHLTDLTELSLSGCCCVPTGLEVLTELKVLDLSGTEVQSLPLENYSKLHKLVLSNCSELDTSMNFGSLSHLEVLDLSGTKMTHFPYEVEHLPYLRELHLLNVKQMQVDWSRVKYLPADLKLDTCEPSQGSSTEITAAPTTESQGPSILVRGTGFFRFLEGNLGLWDTCFKEFHLSVWLNNDGRDEIMKVPGDISVFKYLNPRGRFPDSRNCSLLEIHGSGDFCSELKKAVGRALYVCVVDNEKFKRLSDLGKENVSLVERCWFERCPNLRSIFAIKEDIEIGEQLKCLYLCNLPSLERLHDVKLQSGIFSNLKKLRLDCCPKLVSLCDKSAKYEMPMMQTLELLDLPSLSRIGVEMPSLETLKVRACVKLEELEWNCFMNLKKLHLDCCPKLVYIFYPAKLPENLETLKVQLCNKLETVFKGDESGEYEMPQIQTLELLYLPALKRIGVEMPSLETLKVRACENLHDLELNRFPNLKTKEIDLVSPS
ncbi:putative disease resistance protein At4g19050 [Punica granatum]|uniref:Disease resistance protein At4g19050 n=1 Tax=Punica granatum TaxID=22663 RepID=A0A6P8D651_PUNGR|nr:putative disease resistance protein At4g19050 [Punica granatum]XP_031392030.1 putative disease resistance protein At4g19050 [Punica granatum]XP_031392031.1 putative disease resistance protein At4g19050 [Punica granatum]